MSKRILLTGAAGFIGYHLAKALFKRGDFVVGLDNFNPYYSPKLKKTRAMLLRDLGIEVIKGDLVRLPLLKELFSKHAFTHVVHLAAQAGVRYSFENPKSYLSSNIDGFLSILELLREAPEVPLIYASSSSVYGCNEKVPFGVQDRTDQPANLYAATKKANELMAYSYHHLYKIPMTGLRFFTVYGPWGRPDMAYYSFSKAICEGTPIHLFSQGKMQRDFTYIEDVVDGTLKALDLSAPFELFNLGNHQPIDLLTFVKLLEKHLGKKAHLTLEGERPGEVPTTFADLSHSQKMLGYEPKTSLDEGLSHFARWFLDNKVAR